MGEKEHSQPLSIEDQIENLKSNHLIIDDEEDARAKLNTVSYYRLIKAYGPSLKNVKTGQYKKHISFNHIWKLYEFDNQLRYLLFPQFERIEITLRCRITNHFSVKYGALGYLDENNFKTSYYNDLYRRMSSNIESASKSSIMIQHFKAEYKNQKVPLYAAIEVFSFGTLAYFYKSMKTEDQKEIAKMYYRGDNEYLSSWFDSIAYTRNICAHFGRLYDKQIIILPKLFNSDDYDVKDNQKLIKVLCCMRYTCREYGDWPAFVGGLSDLLDEYKDYVRPSRLGLSDRWKTKLLDQEPNNPFINLV